MIEAGDNELEAVLREHFPLAGPKKKRRPGLGALEQDPAVGPSQGQGLMYSGPVGLQPEGLTGSDALSKDSELQKAIAAGVNPQAVRLLVSAFRAMLRKTHLHASPAGHLAPPFAAEPIDVFAQASLPGGGYGGGSFITVASFTCPDNNRAVISAIGQGLESSNAFGDVIWRFQVDGKSLAPYNSVKMQLFPIVFNGPNTRILLRGGQTVSIIAASLSATAHTALGRLFGWYFPETGDHGDTIDTILQD